MQFHMKVAGALHGGLIVAFVGVALIGVGTRPANACGCGALIRAVDVSEKALVSYHAGLETIVPGLSIDHVKGNAAVLFPVPGIPRVRALPANADVFGELEAITTPPEAQPGASGAGARSPAAAAPNPKVLSRQAIGGYEVTVLRGGTGHTLFGWLHSHRYSLPTGIQGALGSYVTGHWYFVAMRLADRRSGELRPVAIAFNTKQIVYPMRLSHFAKSPVSLELFLNTDGPAAASGLAGLTASFDGTVSSISAKLAPTVRSLLVASQLKRVEATEVPPALIKSDIIVQVAVALHGVSARGDRWRFACPWQLCSDYGQPD